MTGKGQIWRPGWLFLLYDSHWICKECGPWDATRDNATIRQLSMPKRDKNFILVRSFGNSIYRVTCAIYIHKHMHVYLQLPVYVCISFYLRDKSTFVIYLWLSCQVSLWWRVCEQDSIFAAPQILFPFPFAFPFSEVEWTSKCCSSRNHYVVANAIFMAYTHIE